MTVGRLSALAGALLSLPLMAATAATSADTSETVRKDRPIQLAQAPTEEEKKKREQEKKKGQEKGPPPGPKAQPPPPPPKGPPPPPPKAPPPPPPKAPPPPPPPPPPPKGPPPPPAAEKKLLPPDKGPPPPPKGSLSPSVPPGLPPPAKGIAPDAPKGAGPVPEGKKEFPKRVAPGQPPGSPDKGPTALPKGYAPLPKGPSPALAPPPGAPLPPAASGVPPQFKRGPQPAGPAPRFDQVQKGRQERVEAGGRTVIQEPGNRFIVKQDNRIIIQHDEAERFRRVRDARTQRRPDGVTETFYVRPDGFRIVTEVDANGRLMRRYRRGPDGREFAIIDNRRFLRNAGIGLGLGAIGVAIALNMRAPVVDIPREQYIVDYERASDDDLDEALSAPPVDRLDRAYSLEEVRYSYELREHMRRIDLDAVTFEFGAFEVTPDQYPRLERLARSILRTLRRNPDEVFLIEGHTDWVGSDVDNLSLSDRRAEAVAQVLTETFGVPPENLVTQGYGKQYLKIDTQGPERANRRVAVRRITPLMSER
jgi:outer membrane protein OmpA-like peptidoglycan-associated protein